MLQLKILCWLWSPKMMMIIIKYFSGILILINFLQTCYGKKTNPPSCRPSSCGNIRNISYPFRLKDDPKHCGNHDYELSCENNTFTSIYLVKNSQKYLVQAINYDNYTIHLTYPTIKINDSCSFPKYSLSPYHFENEYPYSVFATLTTDGSMGVITSSITFLSCPSYVVNNNSLDLLETTALCFNESNRRSRRRTYIQFGQDHLNIRSDIMDMCSIDFVVMTSLPIKDVENRSAVSLSEIHSSLLYGFELSWFGVECGSGCLRCFPNGDRGDCGVVHCYLTLSGGTPNWLCNKINGILFRVGRSAAYGILLYLALRFIIGMPCMLGLLIYKLRKRRHLSKFEVIEGFLQSNNNLMPIRYSYSNIKKMTKSFQEKLGEGGYGSVYKGTLRSGRDVAIKVLSNKQRANGQDFINEVATIGRIHHVNVVKLVGYCVEGSNWALIYDFMPNGSLEKYILGNERTPNSLSWEKKYNITVGVARGIEYLHRGCDIQILHFDIKPHNILLDDDFTPKISDFGLAKFYSTEKSIVTLTAARGTIGYVAPELINRSIGGISFKADVYSFGMLLMEMVGLKRDVVADDDQSSQYFPYWIYDRFNKGKGIDMENFDEIDDDDGDNEYARKITRKMTIVGLWCIQMRPDDRPSMGEVVKMLEGENENLQIPPRPSESVQINICNNSETWETKSTDSVALLVDDSSSGE